MYFCSRAVISAYLVRESVLSVIGSKMDECEDFENCCCIFGMIMKSLHY
jgi:hypothetical protein